ncbi:hypothetical protein [Actinoalloteichus spitiensis]|uniref:hypothetical protein n=1 Tax=Actinoalloteichus spitiensis TaxID=252394 RepID=UPI0003699109|nr:hypothetical protein [Actinoalloteichus spitiensis]
MSDEYRAKLERGALAGRNPYDKEPHELVGELATATTRSSAPGGRPSEDALRLLVSWASTTHRPPAGSSDAPATLHDGTPSRGPAVGADRSGPNACATPPGLRRALPARDSASRRGHGRQRVHRRRPTAWTSPVGGPRPR